MTSSLSATWRCEQCGERVREARHRTALGRTVCTSCQHLTDAAVLGSIVGGPGAESQVGTAVAVHGARGWLRRALGKRT